jgi:hypothetical protein
MLCQWPTRPLWKSNSTFQCVDDKASMAKLGLISNLISSFQSKNNSSERHPWHAKSVWYRNADALPVAYSSALEE